MRHLLNTLFVTSEDIYLSLDGENVVASREKAPVARYPLHTLSAILTFAYPGASPSLMGACAQRGISLSFCTPQGKFLARVTGEANGNVLLRHRPINGVRKGPQRPLEHRAHPPGPWPPGG